MKHLLPPILLCLLLCGCADKSLPEETAPTTELVVMETSQPEEYGGAVHKMPLNLRKVHGLRVHNDRLILFSDYGSTTLTLLDPDSMEEQSSLTLEFQLEDDALQLHPDGTLSFFDPNTEETVVLDELLREVRHITAPGALTGPPILSPDGSTLFYCTASHVRAWDLDSGIRRVVKEMSFDSQILTGILMDGTVLQCRITEDEEESTLFFSAKDGQLLHRGEGSCQILTEEDRYYAILPAGYNQLLVHGTSGSQPQLLTPAEQDAKAFYLPAFESLVTAAYLEDDRVQLSRYDLTTGTRCSSLTLDPCLYPDAVEAASDAFFMLTYDPAEDRNLLFRWDVRKDTALSSGDSVCYTWPYYDGDLSSLSREAFQLGERYGIRILIGEDATAEEPWDYCLTAEPLVPILRQELTLLEQRLSHYPEEILLQTASHFDRLNLCLVRSATGTSGEGSLNRATGVQFLEGSEAYVVIAAGRFSEHALYHELFHLMETHIFSESKAFDRWDELNPAGFQYDYDYAANALRDSGVYLFQDHRAFVDTYSMSFPKEDRARIMEYAMLPGNSDLFRTDVMQNKLRTLCTGIREAYGLEKCEAAFLWEQYME